MAMGDIGELDLDELENATANDDGENPNLFANVFGVQEHDDGEHVVLGRRPPGRITKEQALNLAAWIIAVTGTDVHDVEELARLAVESL